MNYRTLFMARIESGVEFNKDENHEKLKKRMKNMDTKAYLLNIPSHLHKKVKVKLAKEGKMLSEILIERLEKYISE